MSNMNYTKTGCWIQVSWKESIIYLLWLWYSIFIILYQYIVNHLSRRVWRYQRVIRIPKSKNRQHNGQKKQYKRTNSDLQNIHIKLKIEYELKCSGRVSSSWSTSGTRRVNLVTNPVISHEWGKDREVFTRSGTYHLWHRYSIAVNQVKSVVIYMELLLWIAVHLTLFFMLCTCGTSIRFYATHAYIPYQLFKI